MWYFRKKFESHSDFLTNKKAPRQFSNDFPTFTGWRRHKTVWKEKKTLVYLMVKQPVDLLLGSSNTKTYPIKMRRRRAPSLITSRENSCSLGKALNQHEVHRFNRPDNWSNADLFIQPRLNRHRRKNQRQISAEF